jgi:uncharacterized membrane protein HdeD (DUF308 family)
MPTVLAQRWWVLLLRGICAVAAGIMTIAWPGITLLALVTLFGIFALVDGAAGIVLGIRGEEDGTMWWTMILLGVLSAGAGVLAFAWPGMTALVLLAIIAASAIIRGVLEIVAAIRLRKDIDDEWVLGLSGLLSLAFGILLWVAPGEGALAVVLLIGAYMLALGVMAIALSLRLRRIQHKLKTAQ